MEQTIIMGADHAGFILKNSIKNHLQELNCHVVDVGTVTKDHVDYPDYGHLVAEKISKGVAPFGILLCGTGIGMSIVANRHRGVRAALCWNTDVARLARAHDDANILVLGARVLEHSIALGCVDVFLKTKFEGGRHAIRVDKIEI
jgi:ribose 5-phosphate isomerase B